MQGSPSIYRSRGVRAAAPPSSAAIVRSPRFAGDIRRWRGAEGVRGRTYWHTVDGVRYAHVFNRGLHWYGFYHGPRFYWTCLFADRWWWFDTSFDRWVFWWNGFWWWPSPAGAVFIYDDGDYRPAASEAVQAPDSIPPPPAPEAAKTGGSWTSPDGRRQVQVTGPRSEAFLYDTSNHGSAFLKYLGRDVEKARFSGGAAGKPLQILLDQKGGGFSLYAEDGTLLSSGASPSASAPAATGGKSSEEEEPPEPPPSPQ